MRAIVEAAHDGGVLVDELLAFSRMGRADMRQCVVSLQALVESVVREVTLDAAGRSIDWRIGALPDARGDLSMLRLVVRNLLSNAIKYTRPTPHPRIDVWAEELANEVHVLVHDNGVGFDMRYIDKLFRVFQRLHTASEFEGTGIGLANVRRIVERHGGRVWAHSAPGEGATFGFSLPRIT